MGNLIFNIRIGLYHYQLTKDWKFSKSYNDRHIGNPKRFEVYCAFGVNF